MRVKLSAVTSAVLVVLKFTQPAYDRLRVDAGSVEPLVHATVDNSLLM